MILKQLGIFGWKEQDERFVMASLFAGDPLHFIGKHCGDKMQIANVARTDPAGGLYQRRLHECEKTAARSVSALSSEKPFNKK